mmetsp:Transcript_18756/g.16607  ORF Transcript_18756/g.16607 Transcript_18756/m.16607 type:complete len:112 (+) Transcript_18756:969-1304(+)
MPRSYYSTAPQFRNNFIYVSLISYSGISTKIHVKFANEYGTFGAIKRFDQKEIDSKKGIEAVKKISEKLAEEKEKQKDIFKIPSSKPFFLKPYEEKLRCAREKKTLNLLEK